MPFFRAYISPFSLPTPIVAFGESFPPQKPGAFRVLIKHPLFLECHNNAKETKSKSILAQKNPPSGNSRSVEKGFLPFFFAGGGTTLKGENLEVGLHFKI